MANSDIVSPGELCAPESEDPLSVFPRLAQLSHDIRRDRLDVVEAFTYDTDQSLLPNLIPEAEWQHLHELSQHLGRIPIMGAYYREPGNPRSSTAFYGTFMELDPVRHEIGIGSTALLEGCYKKMVNLGNRRATGMLQGNDSLILNIELGTLNLLTVARIVNLDRTRR